jgi:hypothetical protein
MHLKNKKTQKNQKNTSKNLQDMSPKAFEILLNEILRTEGRIFKEKSALKSDLKEIKKSLKRSAALLLVIRSIQEIVRI